MPGRHASADRSRYRHDLSRVVLLILLTMAVAVAVVLAVRLVVGGSEEPDVTSGTTSPPSTDAITTVASTSSTTSSIPPSTTVSTTTSTTLSTPATTLATTTTLPPVRSPEQVTVLVLNSVRIAGMAGRLTEKLSDLGYRTLEPDNHSSTLETSVIWYLEGFDREAEVLAEQIPDANIARFPGEDPLAPLTVVLGTSYRE